MASSLDLKLLTQYKGLDAPIPHNGKFVLFWDDLWANLAPKLEFLTARKFSISTGYIMRLVTVELTDTTLLVLDAKPFSTGHDNWY